MSKEPKPFAKIEVAEDSVDHYLLVAGEHVDDASIPFGIERLRLGAERINAAVEAREAPLRALITNIRERLETAVDALDDGRMSRAWIEQPVRLALKEITAAQIEEAVSGDVAMGLAFDLGAEKERTAAFAPLLDQLLAQGGKASDLAFDLAQALGLMQPSDVALRAMMTTLTDDELREECRRRGWRPEMGFAPQIDPRARFPRLDRNGRSGVDFGIDPALRPDEATLVQYDGGGVRHVVRIRNIDTDPGALAGIVPDQVIIDEVGEMPDFRRIVAEHEARMPPTTARAEWTRYEGGVGAGNTCANGRCSRFGTRHPGRPCDNRRARGVAGKR